MSSAYSTGSRAIELRQAGGKTTVAEKWFSNRMRVHIGTIIRLGDHVYASSGDFGPAFLTAVDLKTGKIAWQDRSFARAQLLYADGKLIILDEDGNLGLATVSPQGLKVLARAAVLSNVAWTPPTLAGTTLYVRDRKTSRPSASRRNAGPRDHEGSTTRRNTKKNSDSLRRRALSRALMLYAASVPWSRT